MSAFEAYKEYVALKNHFTKIDYDYHRYNGKLRLKIDSFNKRKDKIFFEKIAKKVNVHEFLIANFVLNPKLWIRDLAYSKTAEDTYQSWKKRQQSLTYNFKNDLNKIKDEPKDHHHPAAIRLFLGNEISLESLCLFVALTGTLKRWDERLIYDPVWEDLRLRITKYTPFLKYDTEKLRKIVLDIISD